MRIGLLGPPPWLSSAYGQQLGHLLHILRDLGHEACCFATVALKGAPLTWHGFPVFPQLHHPFGQDEEMHAQAWRADLVIAVMDIWPIELRTWSNTRVIPWFAVDHEPLSPAIALQLGRVERAAVYSQHGLQQCQNAGFTNVSYIPCMVDTNVFRPHPQEEARAALGWPQDTFIVGMVAANVGTPGRKALFQQLRAFALFHEQHPKSLLYLHTFVNAGAEEVAEHIPGMCERLGLSPGKDILIPDQYHYSAGLIPPAHLAACYNAFDVYLGVGHGEGFCVPLVEAQACGTAVICGDWTSMPELCFAGWTVERLRAEVYGKTITDDDMWGQLEGYKVFPRVSAIVAALETAYQTIPEMTPYLRERARAGALPFDVKRVAQEYWLPFLEGAGNG